MIFGNPSSFALLLEPVPAWNTERLGEGILEIFVDRVRISCPRVRTDSLEIHTRHMLGSVQPNAKHDNMCEPLPVSLANLKEAEIYSRLVAMCYPEDAYSVEHEEFRYTITPYALTDIQRCLFWYPKDQSEVILAGDMDLNLLAKTELPRGQLLQTLREAHAFAVKMFHTEIL